MEKRGGKREGAGRKSGGVEEKTESFRMPVPVCERAKELREEGEDVTGAVVDESTGSMTP